MPIARHSIRAALMTLLCLWTQLPERAGAAPETCSDLPSPIAWETEAEVEWAPSALAPVPARDLIDSSRCARMKALPGGLLPVQSAVESAASNASLTQNPSAVFVVGNGMNEGRWFSYLPGCFRTLAVLVADLHHPTRSRQRELHLYTVSGRPVKAHTDAVRGMNLLQLLVEGEAWVWGGVTPGFTFRVGSRAPSEYISLRTLSLSPRVLQVTNVLSDEVIQGLLLGKQNMQRSPEKHYSPGYENYRTSKSSFLAGSHPSHTTVKQTCHAVARLADLNYVEWPQLLKYDPGNWYKSHHDYFHNFKHPKQAENPLRKWISWLKIEFASLGYSNSVLENDITLRPSHSNEFELRLVQLLLQHARDQVPQQLVPWLQENHDRGSSRLMTAFLDEDKGSKMFEIVRKVWEKHTQINPLLVWDGQSGDTAAEDQRGPPWVEPNRHCTMMLYLNEPATGGAETAFPQADHTAVVTPTGVIDTQIEVLHEGIPECSRGLRVQPFKGGGALFYHKLGDGTNDPKSLHSGCPPNEGSVAWKINGFMWNADSGASMQYFR